LQLPYVAAVLRCLHTVLLREPNANCARDYLPRWLSGLRVRRHAVLVLR